MSNGAQRRGIGRRELLFGDRDRVDGGVGACSILERREGVVRGGGQGCGSAGIGHRQLRHRRHQLRRGGLLDGECGGRVTAYACRDGRDRKSARAGVGAGRHGESKPTPLGESESLRVALQSYQICPARACSDDGVGHRARCSEDDRTRCDGPRRTVDGSTVYDGLDVCRGLGYPQTWTSAERTDIPVVGAGVQCRPHRIGRDGSNLYCYTVIANYRGGRVESCCQLFDRGGDVGVGRHGEDGRSLHAGVGCLDPLIRNSITQRKPSEHGCHQDRDRQYDDHGPGGYGTSAP